MERNSSDTKVDGKEGHVPYFGEIIDKLRPTLA